jgi:hypothetical protein
MVKFRFTRKRVITTIAILLIVVLLEVYVHTYIQVGAVSVTPQNNLIIWFTSDTGNYTFTHDNCQWIVRWLVGGTGPNHIPFRLYIFKIGENSNLFGSVGIAVSSLKLESNPSVSLQISPFSLDDSYAATNSWLNLISNVTREFTFDLSLNFYLNTAIGTFPNGELTIPLTTAVPLTPPVVNYS